MNEDGVRKQKETVVIFDTTLRKRREITGYLLFCSLHKVSNRLAT